MDPKTRKLFDSIVNEFPVLQTYSPEETIKLMNEFKDYLFDLYDDIVPQPPCFEYYRDEYIQTVQEKYRKVTLSNLNTFREFYNSIKAAYYTFDEDDVVHFVTDLYFQGFSQGSVRVLISRIRLFYNFLIEKNVILENPFDNVKLSDIEYKSGNQFLVPSEEELKTIISELPIEKAVIVALISIKGYSLSTINWSSFSYAKYTSNQGKVVEGAVCWTEDDMWDYPTSLEQSWKVDITYCPGEFKGLYDFLNLPDWYNKLIYKYWNEIHGETTYCIEGNTVSNGDLFYMNNIDISLHSYENIIVKKMKQLYEEGKIKYSYGLKNLRCYAVKREFINSDGKDLKKIQTMLGHSSLNATKRYLQNMGLLTN